MSHPLLIWGCGGFGRETKDLCELAGIKVAGFLDERPEMNGQIVDGVPVLGDISDVISLRGKVRVLAAGVGDPALKARFAQKTRDLGFDFSDPVIHPQVRIAKSVSLDPGVVICGGCYLTVNIQVHAHVIINLMCSVGHDSILDPFVTISPGVCISGNVRVGEGAYIGTGAAIREKIGIGAWSIVGGGAFVSKDVPERVLVVGVPATWKNNLS